MDLNKNYSLFSIPLAYILVVGSESYGKMLAVKQLDRANPRQFHESISKNDKVDKVTKGRILRSHAAAQNGYETLPLFTGAVIASNMAGVPTSTINLLSLAYLGSRVLYNVIYIHLQENRKFATPRSLAWMVSIGCWFTLYVQAGLRAMRAS
ncbi:uncharacterized protein PG998_000632 [Apiospora kogelbergensis]|uniref:uncharacterized protein n=1 Tax=Apiospora kogelbergensis TaxID=1337665 RepID=UPI00312E71AA